DIPANKIQSSRPPSRDLPHNLSQLKYPFQEVPALGRAGMTICISDIPANKIQSSRPPSRDLPNNLSQLK
ncbi:MAG: hypothetical protein VYD53_15735, partial [Pseudomonadota bacterium]|nr:hypothetical protein [Pseudomonadota bacterium]